MKNHFVVTGTNTGVGKTIFSAGLVNALNASYWKPVQAGMQGETDAEVVKRLSGVDEKNILPESWKLRAPVSPHLAATLDGVLIEVDALQPPAIKTPLVIEGAGGLLVPLTEKTVFIDVFARWQLPVILCAATTLGTINHTLLSVEALKARHIPIFGIAFIGEAFPETEKIIEALSGVKILGRLPILKKLTQHTLKEAFSTHFSHLILNEAS